MASDFRSLFESPPPRDPSLLGPLIKAASRLYLIAFYCALALAVALAAIIAVGADRDKILTILPSALVPLFMLGGPALGLLRRSRRRLSRIAIEGERYRARVTKSDLFSVGYGAVTNRIVAELTTNGTGRVVQLAVGGQDRRHQVGDEIEVLFSPRFPRVVIAHSDRLGVELGRALTQAEDATPRRARRIAIGVVIGSLLFVAMMALIVWSQR